MAQPVAYSWNKPVMTGARERIAKKTYIRGKGYDSPAFDAALAKVRAVRSWSVLELPCGTRHHGRHAGRAGGVLA